MEVKRPTVLFDEVFTFGVQGSCWEIDDRGGKITSVGHLCNVLLNNSNSFPIRLWRTFKEQTEGKVTFEFRFRIKRAVSGFCFELKNGKSHAFRMITEGNNLCYHNGKALVTVLEYEEDIIYALKAIVDLDKKKTQICINGKDYGYYSLADQEGKIDTVVLTSPTSEPTEIHFYYIKMYRDYIVYEKFANCSSRRLPYDWKFKGAYQSDAYVEYIKGYDAYDSHVLTIADGRHASDPTIVSKTFEKCGGRLVFEYRFYLANPEWKKEGIAFSLMSGERTVVAVTAKLGGIYAGDELLRIYNPNVWQRVRIIADLDIHKADVTVNNSKLGILEIPKDITCVDCIQFKTQGTEWVNCQIDAIMLYADAEPPKDYPSRPIKPKTDYRIGMQTCFLWEEGKGPGWDKIECYPERKPYLGFYDDRISPEKVDWEIKWMAEHGISFILPCWYSADGYCGGPVREASLYEDYFAAKYRDDVKIALQICDIGNIGLKDFKEYLVPFWMENFFMVSNYMLINNKPLIAFISGIQGSFGSVEHGREALKFLNEACKAAGFDGVFAIANEQHRISPQVRITTSYGFDAIYSYAWGRNCHLEHNQIDILNAQRDMNLIKIIPTVSQGYNDLAWNGFTHGGYITPGIFKTTLEWVRDDFLKSDVASGEIENMVLLDNWNEYGEGHFFMPTELYGFRYLDVIREVFTDNNPHEDIRPTETQLDRLQTLYPKGRKALKCISAKPNRNGKIIKGWYFNHDDDAKVWGASEGIENLRVENGMLTGDVSHPEGYLRLQVPLALNCKDVCYIRTRIKHEEVEISRYTYEYITENDGTWDEEKCVSEWVTERMVEECYLPTYNKKSLQNIVTGLKMHPAGSCGKFYIESIELIEYDINPTRIYADGKEYRFFAEPIEENGVMLAPLVEIGNIIGVYTYWDYQKNKMLVADENVEMWFTFGSDIVLVNGIEENIEAAPIMLDRVAYLPIHFICERIGKKMKYISEKKEMYFGEKIKNS